MQLYLLNALCLFCFLLVCVLMNLLFSLLWADALHMFVLVGFSFRELGFFCWFYVVMRLRASF